jgi:ubiquinone/menaquinone biosynthesis C-methylase UbiE
MTNDGVNPWLEISAADYEEHMGPNSVGQLSVLSKVFGQEYGRLKPGRLAVLGCATGNGLERVDPGITHRTVGVDLNQRYLEIARARLTRLGKGLELICAPLEACEFESGESQEIPLRFGKQFYVQAFTKPRLFCPGSDNSWEAA